MFEYANIEITIKDLHNLWAYRFKFPTTIQDSVFEYTELEDQFPMIVSV